MSIPRENTHIGHTGVNIDLLYYAFSAVLSIAYGANGGFRKSREETLLDRDPCRIKGFGLPER